MRSIFPTSSLPIAAHNERFGNIGADFSAVQGENAQFPVDRSVGIDRELSIAFQSRRSGLAIALMAPAAERKIIALTCETS